jgi:hypothetical protein
MIYTSLNKALVQRLNTATAIARKAFGQATIKDKSKLEDVWDIEHAYYSSALEGSNIDRKEFDTLAKQAR